MASINHLHTSTEVILPQFIKKYLSKSVQNNSKWVYELKSSLHFDELQLQRAIGFKIKEQLPSFDFVYYNKTIVSANDPTQRSKPDFLMWKKDYSEWFMIEVELENHSLPHIKFQISTFYDGDYSDVTSITKYVQGLFPTLDYDKFLNMIKNNRPKIMLIADHIQQSWSEELSKYGCLFSSIQIYCDDKENFSYRFNGEWPQEYKDYSFSVYNKSIRAIEISSPRFLNNFDIKEGEKILIYYKGVGEYWNYMYENNKEILVFDGDSLSLDLFHKRWMLIRNNKKQFHLLKS